MARLTPIESGPRPLIVSTSPELFLQLGMEMGWAVHPVISIGITDFTFGGGVSSIEGVLFNVSLTPYVEAGGFIDSHIHVYGRVGLGAQIRSRTRLGEDYLQLGAYGGAGIRFFAAHNFAIGLELSLYLVLTDAYRVGNIFSIDVPQAATPGSASLSTSWFF